MLPPGLHALLEAPAIPTLLLLHLICLPSPRSPEAADAYLSSLASSSGPAGGLLPGSSSGSINGDYTNIGPAGSEGGGPGSAAAAGAAATIPLHFPAWREVSGAAADRLLAVPHDMAVMAGAVLPGVTARSLAEVRQHVVVCGMHDVAAAQSTPVANSSAGTPGALCFAAPNL
jgi:hypothetical protein